MDPFIQIVFMGYTGDEDPIVSLVVFEWKDEDLIGVYPTADSIQVRNIRTKRFVYKTDAVHRKLEYARKNGLRPGSANRTTLESSSFRPTPL